MPRAWRGQPTLGDYRFSAFWLRSGQVRRDCRRSFVIMTSATGSQQVLPVLKNTLRFRWKSPEVFLERREFGLNILFGALSLKKDDLLCLQRNNTDRFFDVTFYNLTKMEETKRLADRLADGPLNEYQVKSLCRTGERVITIHIYNPWVTEEAIGYFLSKHVTVISGMREIMDSLDVWTGKRQFRVRLKDNPDGCDGFHHPPASFTIGTNRGYLYYPGQPLYCRKCTDFGHTAESCTQVRCRNCKGLGHTMGTCDRPKKCNLCGSEGHLFKHCPEVRSSYASIVRRPMFDDPEASSLKAINDEIDKLFGNNETEAGVVVPSEQTPPPEEKKGKETATMEESPSVTEWTTVESRGGKGKKRRKHTPPLDMDSGFGVLSEVLEEPQKERGRVNGDQDVEVAAKLDGLESGEHGQSSVRTGVTDPGGGVPSAGVVLVESPIPHTTISDKGLFSEQCSLSSEGNPPNSGHSVPEEETLKEGF